MGIDQGLEGVLKRELRLLSYGGNRDDTNTLRSLDPS